MSEFINYDMFNIKITTRHVSENLFHSAKIMDFQNKIFDQMGRLTHKNSKRNATFVQIVQSWDYQYDAMNNIKSRIDNVNFQRENFEYDNLNRLLEVHHGYLNQQLLGLVQSMNYDNLGNITFKTDVGNMQYSPTHPFQMEMLTENPQTITSEHVLEYFVSGRTKTIEDNDKKLQFTYGSDLQRRKMEYFLEDQLQSTTLYPFGNYEEVHNAATNDVLKYNYIGSPDGLIAIRKTINGTSQLYYTLTDHLGSIDALCDENGSVVERYSYDAWGNRRNPSDWTLADIRTSFITNRGFTGHEHLDKFGLINANARMYEPLTGKFLAPDPYVQAPDYSQSFNRYTYCWNNPVKYTDPSGEIILPLYFVFFTETGYDLQKYVLPMAVKVDVGFGNNQGVGIRTSVGAPQALPKSARVHGSAGYWWKNGEIPEGWMFTYGYELGISPFIIVGSTKYVTPGSPEFNQRTGHARIGIPGFNIKYENDGVMWFLGDNGDRYRTAGAKIQVGIFSIGVNLFTGDPGFDGKDRYHPEDPLSGKETYIISKKGDDPNKYRAGIGYIGIGSFRFGNDKESRRHYIQNEKIHGDKYPWFTYDKTRQNRSYFQFGTGGGYLW